MTKPIIFNTDMVHALLDGRKTVTRRTAFKADELREFRTQSNADGWWFRGRVFSSFDAAMNSVCGVMKLRKFRPGDILWVRETWQFIPCIDCRMYEYRSCNDVPVTYDDGNIIGEGCFVYRADYPETDRISWRPSIHMPRAAARIFLRVTDVRVERLRCLTLEQAHMEGQPRCNGGLAVCGGTQSCQDCEADTGNAVRWFSGIWDNTIKPADRATFGWDANPWVWVIGFEQISKEAFKDETERS